MVFLCDIMNQITETRIYCGFRENMIQVANRPCDEVTLEWPICLHLESMIQDVILLLLRRYQELSVPAHLSFRKDPLRAF